MKGCDYIRTENSLYCSNHKCESKGCKRKRLDGCRYCATHQSEYNKNVRSKYGITIYSPGKSSNSSRSVDPDDHDIEGYHEDNRDEFDDIDDAYDAFLDDDDAWDDY